MLDQPLAVHDISFSYSDTDVLRDVSFQVNRQDFAGIVGSNGAGKSTLLKLILGELIPQVGEIRIFGKTDFSNWERIGYIAQNNADLNPAFPATVLEVVQANLYRKVGFGRPVKREHQALALDALGLTGVRDLAKKRIGELSGGQQQRVFLARALVNRPELLILDEATSGIDERSEGLFYDLLEKLKQEMGLTILMVSHDMAAVTAHANRLFCLGVDGFFEHEVRGTLDQQFFSRLYGYEVTPHIHSHNCADHEGLAGDAHV